jgi:ketosteroid isomerase-like protein
MKRRTITGLLLGFAAVASAEAFAAPSASAAAAHGGRHGFERFLRRYEAANTAFQNGDPTLWLSLTAGKDPASIFGGFGGLGEAGAATVHQRYLLAATAFRPSGATVDFQYLVQDVRGDLAYTVAIERSDVIYAGRTEPHHQVLRVTMIFRFERGSWRIAHRHADTMVDLELPTTAQPRALQ